MIPKDKRLIPKDKRMIPKGSYQHPEGMQHYHPRVVPVAHPEGIQHPLPQVVPVAIENISLKTTQSIAMKSLSPKYFLSLSLSSQPQPQSQPQPLLLPILPGCQRRTQC